MEKTLTEICEELNNYFPVQKIDGTFTIVNGSLNLPFLKNGQYFRIVGSIFNDGVHKYPCANLATETFNGSIWSMAVPSAVIDLAGEVASWVEKYGGVDSPNMSPYTSESFNNYSYSKGSKSGSEGDGGTWQSVYSSKLNRYRRLRGI